MSSIREGTAHLLNQLGGIGTPVSTGTTRGFNVSAGQVHVHMQNNGEKACFICQFKGHQAANCRFAVVHPSTFKLEAASYQEIIRRLASLLESGNTRDKGLAEEFLAKHAAYCDAVANHRLQAQQVPSPAALPPLGGEEPILAARRLDFEEDVTPVPVPGPFDAPGPYSNHPPTPISECDLTSPAQRVCTAMLKKKEAMWVRRGWLEEGHPEHDDPFEEQARADAEAQQRQASVQLVQRPTTGHKQQYQPPANNDLKRARSESSTVTAMSVKPAHKDLQQRIKDQRAALKKDEARLAALKKAQKKKDEAEKELAEAMAKIEAE
jgi:hypothetical protein